jgi:hypothetical protein
MSLKVAISSANGNVDVTQYLMVERGAGMEPGDPTFTEKVFARSLLKQGATLALEHFREKELVMPLLLKATNKTNLANLVQEINTVINTPGAQLEWQDEGATQPTFYDVVSGQLDDDFDYRLSEKNGLRAKLRIFAQPLGYLNKFGARAVMVSGVATTLEVGSGPLQVFPASGLFDGDAQALIQAQVELTSQKTSGWFAFSLLPGASYAPYMTAPSVSLATGSRTFTADTVAAGGTYAHWREWSGPLLLYTAPEAIKFSYVGETRLLVLARTPSGANVLPIRTDRVNSPWGSQNGPVLGPVATPVATAQWIPYDLGTISRASAGLGSGDTFDYLVRGAITSPGASCAIDICAVVQLPDTNTIWLNTNASPVAFPAPIVFDGVTNAIRVGASMGVPASGIAPLLGAKAMVHDLTSMTRGRIPPISASASSPVFAALAMDALSLSGGSLNKEMSVAINVLERTRYVF